MSHKVISCSKEIMVLRNFYRKYNRFFVYFFSKFLNHHHQPKVLLNRNKTCYVVLIVTLNSSYVTLVLAQSSSVIFLLNVGQLSL